MHFFSKTKVQVALVKGGFGLITALTVLVLRYYLDM